MEVAEVVGGQSHRPDVLDLKTTTWEKKQNKTPSGDVNPTTECEKPDVPSPGVSTGGGEGTERETVRHVSPPNTQLLPFRN